MIPASDIKDALTVESVLDRYGLAARLHGSEYRLKICPACQGKSKHQAIAISARTGRWFHHGPGCSGDLLDLIAACEGIDCKRDFRRVLDIAAELAGLSTLDEAAREKAIRDARERSLRDAADDQNRQRAAVSAAGAAWASYARYSDRGVAYLESRGLDPSFLINRDVVRFTDDSIAVALRSAEGSVISTARRLYEGPIRMLTLKDCSSKGYMIDCAADIRADVVVTEGIVDSLTARQAWPHAVILGASGAALLPALVRSIVPRIRLAACRLLLVTHDDEVGIEKMTVAAGIAIAAGLELGGQLHLVEFPHKDLNDAWKAGWRP